MKIMGVVLAGFYAFVAALSSSATGDAASPPMVGGSNINIDCAKDKTANTSVSQPNTTVTVTCDKECTTVPKDSKYTFVDAECTKEGLLSSVCPGATVTPAKEPDESEEQKKMNVSFPQLPPSAQAVCVKCAEDCKAVINVAAALPQGPQACAVPGTSVTLHITEARGSAQFKCGTDLTLMPREATKAYADDCMKEETLEDMTRSPGPGNYVTLRVDKLKKKKMCFLCKQGAADGKKGGEQNPCTIYVDVSAGTRLSSSIALACVAAVLHLT